MKKCMFLTVIVLLLMAGTSFAGLSATYVHGRYINEGKPDSNFQQPSRPLEHAGGYYSEVRPWTFWELPTLGAGETFGDGQYSITCERYGSASDAFGIEVHEGLYTGDITLGNLTWNTVQAGNLMDATVWAEATGPSASGDVVTWTIPAALLNSAGSGGSLQLVTKYRDDTPTDTSGKADWFGGSSDTGTYQPAPTLMVDVVPEPMTLSFLGIGAGLALLRRKRN